MVLGLELGNALHADTLTLQDIGLDRLAEKAEELQARYSAFTHPGAQELLRWLAGDYLISHELVQTQ